jgi:ketosteroid isomerase-like protein
VENVQGLAASGTRVVDRAYVDRRLAVFPTGFVQQHVLRGTRTQDGVVVELPACLVAEVADGRITRLDGYFDSAHVAELTKYA